MTQDNLWMAVFPDDNDSLRKTFFESLPNDIKPRFNFDGCIGNLEDNFLRQAHTRRDFRVWKDSRRVYIFQGRGFENVNKDETFILKVPDELVIAVLCAKYKKDWSGHYGIYTKRGDAGAMVKHYNHLISIGPEEVLKGYAGNKEFRRHLVRKSFRGKLRISKAMVGIGLETHDGKYLLASTGFHGPYTVMLDKRF